MFFTRVLVKDRLGRYDLLQYLLQAISFSCFIILLAYQFLGANSFPYTDDWHFLDYVLGIKPISWDWLWQLHVDHRLPLQKILQVPLLWFSSADYRILVFANAVFAYVAVLFMLKVVRLYRGRA